MKLKDVIRKYPDSFVVIKPLVREAVTLKPLTFKVLAVLFSAGEAVAAKGQYVLDGLEDVCVLPTYEQDMGFPPEETARLFRVLYGMAGVPAKGFKVLYEAGRCLGGSQGLF